MMGGGGALDSSVTLDEVFTVLSAKRAPLAPELAGYLVLEIAEHADPQGGDLDLRSVFIGEEGTVALIKPRREAAAGDAEASVRGVLGRLLEASGSQTPALAAASRRQSGGGLSSLAEELETALIPVNRAAGRRALARLAREVRRVTLGVGRNALPSASETAGPARRPPALSLAASSEVGSAARAPSSASLAPDEDPTLPQRPMPSDVSTRDATNRSGQLPTQLFEPPSRSPGASHADVDSLIAEFGVSASADQQHARALKAMAGLDPTPPPSATLPPSAMGSVASDPFVRPPSQGARTSDEGAIDTLLAKGGKGSAAPPPEPFRQARTQPSEVRRSQGRLPNTSARPQQRGWLLPALLAALALSVGAAAVRLLRPAGGVSPQGEASALMGPDPSPPHLAPICRGTLVVSNVPQHAEVLVREGQAPVDVERMPVGARLEFVATADGYSPKRVVVPSGASWDQGPDGRPRFEAAVQLDRSKGTSDPWPAGEPGSEVGGQGPPGTVRVVATPRGAEIWMLAGIGPDARVDQIPCDRDWDILVAGPTTFRRRIHVTSADFKPGDKPGTRTATISAK
jgi:hypothetical protein